MPKVAEEFKKKGTFVLTVAALAANDTQTLGEILLEYQGRNGSLEREHPFDMVQRVCQGFEEGGFSFVRKGWTTVRHPDLGTLQWRVKFCYQTNQPYFMLRLNGYDIHNSLNY